MARPCSHSRDTARRRPSLAVCRGGCGALQRQRAAAEAGAGTRAATRGFAFGGVQMYTQHGPYIIFSHGHTHADADTADSDTRGRTETAHRSPHPQPLPAHVRAQAHEPMCSPLSSITVPYLLRRPAAPRGADDTPG